MAQPTRYSPNTIWLGGPRTVVNHIPASEAIMPGMLIEVTNSGGLPAYRKAATADSEGSTYATEQAHFNLTVDDAYAANDIVEASVGVPGSYFWALIGSGQSVVNGATLGNAGTGYLKAATTKVIARAAETKDNTAGPGAARIRIEVV